jgi:hypothetical protein
MPPKNGDITKIVISNDERLTEIEQKVAVHHERIGIVEKATASMSLIPQTVAALAQKVESMDTSMKREVDGLREQSKAHKEDTEKKMIGGFTEIGVKVEQIGTRVDAMATKNVQQSARQKGWWEVIQATGQILLGLAVIGEFLKAVLSH